MSYTGLVARMPQTVSSSFNAHLVQLEQCFVRRCRLPCVANRRPRITTGTVSMASWRDLLSWRKMIKISSGGDNVDFPRIYAVVLASRTSAQDDSKSNFEAF